MEIIHLAIKKSRQWDSLALARVIFPSLSRFKSKREDGKFEAPALGTIKVNEKAFDRQRDNACPHFYKRPPYTNDRPDADLPILRLHQLFRFAIIPGV